MTRKQRKTLTRIVISAAALVMLVLINSLVTVGGKNFNSILHGIPNLVLFVALYIAIGGDILRKAFLGITRGQVFDENFLMVTATLGAFALAIIKKNGDYTEGIAVMLFYQIGEFFQSIAVGKSRKSIASLMDIRPDYANIEKDGNLVQVSPSEVEIGTVITVRPGERIPIDGVIEEGSGSLDMKALTGESVPRDCNVGDEVFSGSISINGEIKIRTTKAFSESTASKILELVENSTSKKSRSETFISRFAKVYTPFVTVSALVIAVLPPIIQNVFGLSIVEGTGFAVFETWLYRALTFLVISCPCALVISIPLSFFSGIGGASRNGILVKGSVHLENLSKVSTVVFDKTGTLTEGVFSVSSVSDKSGNDADFETKERIIRTAAFAECSSTHPVGRSIIDAYGKAIDRSRVSEIEERSGLGIVATVDGTKVAVGNEKLMESMEFTIPNTKSDGTKVHVASGGKYSGCITISDRIKANSKKAIGELKKSGIRKTVMLTGDGESAARNVAENLMVDGFFSGLLPADKVRKIEELLSEKKSGEMVSFVGDGINDAPVLARSDVGIAMGAMGSDAAIEAADIVLMDDDPMKISRAIKISRRCLGIVRQNIVFSLAVKGACLVLGAAGIANMWLAIFADVGVMVIAVLNASRALVGESGK